MTPLPKRRMSSGRSGKRRKQIVLEKQTVVNCENCKSLKIPHQVCGNCGTYKGAVLVAPKIKTKVTRITSDEK